MAIIYIQQVGCWLAVWNAILTWANVNLLSKWKFIRIDVPFLAWARGILIDSQQATHTHTVDVNVLYEKKNEEN